MALSLDGRPARRIRLSRVSRSALEGGRREQKRRDRWFKNRELNLRAVLETGSPEWMVARRRRVEEERASEVSVSRVSEDDEE